jgi:hypothetical protein
MPNEPVIREHDALLSRISEPYTHTFVLKNGERRTKSVRTWVFVINGKTHDEIVTNSTWPGGVLSDGKQTSPAKAYRWLSSLTGQSDPEVLAEYNVSAVRDVPVRVRMEHRRIATKAGVRWVSRVLDVRPRSQVAPEEEDVPF